MFGWHYDTTCGLLQILPKMRNFSLILLCFLGLVGSCIGIFVLAALYEGLKVFREFLKRRYGGVVSLNFDTKVYGPGNSQTAIITETKGSLPR